MQRHRSGEVRQLLRQGYFRISNGMRLNSECPRANFYGYVSKATATWKIYAQYRNSPEMVYVDIKLALY